jgi:hypothetical protein
VTPRDALIAVLVLLVVVAAGAGAYLLGASSVPQADDAAAAEADAAAAAYADARDEGRNSGRSIGSGDGALVGEAISTVRGSVGGARAGKAAAMQQRRETLSARQGASATTRSEAERAGARELAGDGDVLVVGDSLEVGSSPYLDQYLSSTRLTVNADVGLSSPEIFERFEQSYDPSQSVIVFDAGTNDSAATPSILGSQLDAVAGVVGNRCMVVPTVHVGDEDRSAMNQVIRSFAASHPGTQVPDWARFAAANSGLMSADGVHPTSAGYQQRAQLIADGIRACLGGF